MTAPHLPSYSPFLLKVYGSLALTCCLGTCLSASELPGLRKRDKETGAGRRWRGRLKGRRGGSGARSSREGWSFRERTGTTFPRSPRATSRRDSGLASQLWFLAEEPLRAKCAGGLVRRAVGGAGVAVRSAGAYVTGGGAARRLCPAASRGRALAEGPSLPPS